MELVYYPNKLGAPLFPLYPMGEIRTSDIVKEYYVKKEQYQKDFDHWLETNYPNIKKGGTKVAGINYDQYNNPINPAIIKKNGYSEINTSVSIESLVKYQQASDIRFQELAIINFDGLRPKFGEDLNKLYKIK